MTSLGRQSLTPENHIADRAGKMVDDEEDAARQQLSQDQAHKKRPSPMVALGTAVLEHEDFDEPSQEHIEPQVVHNPRRPNGIAQRMQRPPSVVPPGHGQAQHDGRAQAHVDPAPQMRLARIAE